MDSCNRCEMIKIEHEKREKFGFRFAPKCIDCMIKQYQPERSKREDLYIEFGCSSPVEFNTSAGRKRLEPGKKYDENLDEIIGCGTLNTVEIS